MIGLENLDGMRFERELRGYCPEEVDGFLDQMVVAWRTGSGPNRLLELVRERQFSIAVRGYSRAEVDRVIDEMTTDWRRSEVQAALSTETAGDPFAEAVEPAHDAPPSTHYAPLFGAPETAVDAVEPADRDSTLLPEPTSHITEDPALVAPPTDAEHRGAGERMEQAEQLFRRADETRLLVIGILDQAAHDLAHGIPRPTPVHDPRQTTSVKPEKTRKAKGKKKHKKKNSPAG
jgi:DivIVA domain-containing protein